MKKLRYIFAILICFVVTLSISAQSYNEDRVAFTNFLIRMYNNAPFEGVRAVNDYDNAFLISVLALDKEKYKTEAILNRVASVKAMANASRYFNGSNIFPECTCFKCFIYILQFSFAVFYSLNEIVSDLYDIFAKLVDYINREPCVIFIVIGF